MVDFATAVQNAFMTALNVTPVNSLGAVMQFVPENTQPPLIVVGDVNLEPAGGKDGGFDRASVDVITLCRGEKRATLFAMQAAVRAALDGKAISSSGVILSRPTQLSSDSDLLDDGVTYIGTQSFETYVQ